MNYTFCDVTSLAQSLSHGRGQENVGDLLFLLKVLHQYRWHVSKQVNEEILDENVSYDNEKNIIHSS